MTNKKYIQKIVPFIWFEKDAADAARFYTSLFDNSRIISETPMSVIFELEGQAVYAFNGGPHFKLNEAFSLFVNCETQAEVDELWAKLTDGGTESRCGWLRDRFGLWWQIIPTVLSDLLSHPDKDRANRAMQAMMKMKKIDIQALLDS